MKLQIRNMVCPRCIMAVQKVFEQNSLTILHIALGEVILEEKTLPKEKSKLLDQQLTALGFELINDRQHQLIEAVKNIIIDRIHHQKGALENQKLKWSAILSDALHQDYKNISRLFSSVEGITVEQFIIKQKIEKVKELLIYDQFTLSEIAWKLGYSSVAHLSGQFQKITGMSPSNFKKQTSHSRSFIDQL